MPVTDTADQSNSNNNSGAGSSNNGNSSNNNSNDGPPKSNKRRKRSGRQRERNSNNGSGKKSGGPKGPPQPPQLKVTIRNIQNVDLCGTVAGVVERVVRPLMDIVNSKLSVGAEKKICLKLDECGLAGLLQAEEMAREARREWEASLEEKEKDGENKEDASLEEKETQPTTPTRKGKRDDAGKGEPKKAESAVDNLPVDESCVSVRVLYTLPPKRTKRRGTKPGCAYLVLTTAPIPARAPPEPPVSEETDAPSSKPTAVDYSLDVARRRLMIQRSVESMTKAAEEDAKSRQSLCECFVEESASGKSWKARATFGNRRDRVEGTIQDTNDFKAFFEKSAKELEERKSRPRPAPGGGMVATSTASSTTASAEEPVAAIVVHLRKKKEEEKKRKQQAKKKAKDSKKAAAAASGKQAAATSGTGGAAKEGSGRKSKRNKSKKKKAAAAKAASS